LFSPLIIINFFFLIMGPVKKAALKATNAHKAFYFQNEYTAKIKEMLRSGYESVVDKAVQRQLNQCSYFLSGMYQIRLFMKAYTYCNIKSTTIIFELASHLDKEFDKKPKFIRHGEFKKLIQIGYHESYLTSEKRHLVYTEFHCLIDRHKNELLQMFRACNIEMRACASFERCCYSQETIDSWIHVQRSGIASFFIYGTMLLKVDVMCQDGDYVENRKLYVLIQSDANFDDVGEKVVASEQLIGLSLSERFWKKVGQSGRQSFHGQTKLCDVKNLYTDNYGIQLYVTAGVEPILM